MKEISFFNKSIKGSGILIICLFLFNVGLYSQDEKKVFKPVTIEAQDTTIGKGLTFNGYPYAFSTPETSLAFGVGGIFIFYTADKENTLPSKSGVSGYYTTSGQYKFSLNTEMYFFDNKVYFKMPLSIGHFVDKFWGLGRNSINQGIESYTKNEVSASFSLQVPPAWFSSDRTGLFVDYSYTSIDDRKENPFLQDKELVGGEGGHLFGIGIDWVWDKRDHLFFPNKGNYQSIRLVAYPKTGINDYAYVNLEMDVRHFASFSPDHVFAANIYMAVTNGDVPFYRMPALGGQNIMRGYFKGRYRDRFYGAIQVEYRQYFWRRFGFVVFAGLGDVAESLIEISARDLKYSLGFGLRYLFNKEEKVNLRMDVGFGKDGNHGIYFGIEEAF
jgi:outer membrane protein assembly factor BamA